MSALMQSPDGGQMNVPDQKVAAFEADGWTVISRSADSVAAETAPPAADAAPSPSLRDGEGKDAAEIAERIAPKPKKAKAEK